MTFPTPTLDIQWVAAWLALWVGLTIAAEMFPGAAPVIGVFVVGFVVVVVGNEIGSGKLGAGIKALG